VAALRYNRIAAGVRAIVEEDFEGLFAITGYGQTLAQGQRALPLGL
jgi:hypothetical protein